MSPDGYTASPDGYTAICKPIRDLIYTDVALAEMVTAVDGDGSGGKPEKHDSR